MGKTTQNENDDYMENNEELTVREKKSVFFYFVLTGFCVILMIFMVILYVNNKKATDMGGQVDESVYYSEEGGGPFTGTEETVENIESQLTESEDVLSEIYTSLMFGSYASDSGQTLSFDGNGNVVKKGGANSGGGTYHLSYSTQKDLYTIEILINGVTYYGTADAEIMTIRMEDGTEFVFE